MTDWIKFYVRVVTHLFPFLGRQERQYLRHLRNHLEDCFEERKPTSMEEIVEKVGPPEQVLSEYLSAVEPDYLIQRIRQAQWLRLLSVVVLMVLVVVAVVCARHVWLEYQNYLSYLDDMLGYYIEVIE